MEFRRVLFRSIQSLPKPLRGWAATLLSVVAPAQRDAVLNGLRRASAGRLARGLNADKLPKLSTLPSSPDQRDFYRPLSSPWSDRKSTRLNSSHHLAPRKPHSALTNKIPQD